LTYEGYCCRGFSGEPEGFNAACLRIFATAAMEEARSGETRERYALGALIFPSTYVLG
jgi:hypothetical protein